MTAAWCSLAIAAALVAGAAIRSREWPAPLVVNESGSVARGLYLRTAAPIAPGRLVVLAPPPAARGYLAALGAGPDARLLKRVAAIGGEFVCTRAAWLIWPRGAVVSLSRDRRGRRLVGWTGCRRLAPDELLVVGDTPTSFDSRYFGPVPRRAVEGVYRELWSW